MAALFALLVLGWASATHKPWGELGYVRPRSWLVSGLGGIAGGVLFKILMKALVMPLLGAPETNAAYHGLVGNTAALPGMAFTMIFIAGFGEETVFRGFLFDRLGKWLGRGAGAKIATVLITSALFAALHYADQGIAGVEQAAVTGLVFGSIFAVTGKLWTLMIAHAAFDLAAVAIIYRGVEPQVAHLIFK